MHRHRHQHQHFAPDGHGHRGRHRARRGAIVNATLLLLDERPMHGYEIITELEARSDGRWRPSPGTMYPALGRMEHHELIAAEEVDGKKRFSLTDHGRERLVDYRSNRSDDDLDPWEEASQGGRGDLRGHVSELVGPVRQIGRFGTAEQIAAAEAVLTDTKKRLYAILASSPDEAEDDREALPN